MPAPGALTMVSRPAAIDVEDAGHAQHRVASEHQRVEEGIVDAPVDDVDLLEAQRRLHHQRAVDDDEVLALHQLDAHLVGKERVLEVGAVVDAGGEHDDGGLAVEAGRRDAFQRQAQVVRIVLHRAHAVAGEQLGEHVHHRLPVLQHVGDARGRARVVLEHEELVLGGAHEVDADDVRIDAARRLHAHHLRHEGRVLDDQVLGHAAGPDDLLAMIDVVHEGVERAHALLDAGGEAAPLGGAQDARDDVEGDEALGGGIVAVDGEGDAGAAEQRLGVVALALEVVDLLRLQPLVHGRVGLAHPAAGPVHLVECGCQRIPHAAGCAVQLSGNFSDRRIRDRHFQLTTAGSRTTCPIARQVAPASGRLGHAGATESRSTEGMPTRLRAMPDAMLHCNQAI